MQEIPEEESDLSHTVHALLLKASNGRETLTAPTASECLKQAGLGLRFVQASGVRDTGPRSAQNLSWRQRLICYSSIAYSSQVGPLNFRLPLTTAALIMG